MSKKIIKAVNKSGKGKSQAVTAFNESAPFLQNTTPMARNPIRLTISILVSNRIGTVRKCLDSIKPLLDALPSELIVVDTVGPERSDGSLAVAQEYTDRIVHFHWCDDFAAARNAGLDLAKGEWFLYLDDDEWFEDVSPIIDFLKTNDPKYNTCLYKVRNYKDRGGQRYTEAYVSRLYRRNLGVHFIDRIHEHLFGAKPLTKTLDAFVHHYGYIYDSQEEYEKHYLRNIQPLEKMLEEQPDNLRAVVHLAQEYIQRHEYQKAENMCRGALEKNSFININNDYSKISALYIQVLILAKRWGEVLDQSDRLLRRPDISELAKCSICYQRNECTVFGSEKLLSNVDEYFQYLEILDADPDKLPSQLGASLSACLSEQSRASIMEYAMINAAYLGDEEHSWEYIRRTAKNPGKHHLILEKCLPLMVRFVVSTNSFGRLYSLIEPHLEMDSSLTCFLSSVQSYLEPLQEYKRPITLTDFLARLPLDKPYIVLMKIRIAEKAGDVKRLAGLIEHYFDLEGVGFVHEILQIAFRNDLDLSKCTGKIYIGQWDSDMHLLVNSCTLVQVRSILQYLRGYFPEDSPEVLSLETLVALKTLKENKGHDSAAQSEGFCRYVDLLYTYNLMLNNSENFSEERSHYLNPGARAAFYLKQSIDCGRMGDLASQLRMLKKALHLRNDLVDFIDMMMKDLGMQIERMNSAPKVQANAEFQALAVRLKSVAAEFVLKGDNQNAKIILDQLNQLLPSDPDIPNLYKQLIQ